MSNSTTIKDLALIGAGYWGKNLARNFNALGRLGTLCDRSEKILGSYGPEYVQVKKCTNLESVMEDPTVTKVAIAAPAVLHYQLARQALIAGKDVFVEKPLCLDIGEAEELVQLADTNKRILMVGHLLQYHPCITHLLRMVSHGELGKLQYITSNRLNLGKIRQEENALWSFAPHDISVILSLVGGELPNQVRCIGESYLNPGVADTTLTTLRFQNSVRAHVYVSWLNPFKEQKLTVVGSQGMVVFDDTKPWTQKLEFHQDHLKWTEGKNPVPSKTPGQRVEVAEAEPLECECRHFLEACANRTVPRTDGAEGLRVLKVLRAAQKSLEKDGDQFSARSTGVSSVQSYYSHPSSVVDAGAQIGKGTKIWHFAHISPKAVVGERCIFGQNTFVAEEVRIGNNVKVQNNVAIYTGTVIEDDVFLGPSCVLTNVTNPRSQVVRHSLYEKTLIRRGATIGANATIVCGISIGRYAFVAAGSVVTKDVPDYAMVLGTPARQKGWMSRHGHVLKPGADGVLRCPESGYRYAEEKPGVLRCLDLGEEAPLPAELAVGKVTYDQLKG